VEKFEAFGLTPVQARRGVPPLVAECFANLECRVSDSRLVTKFNLFVLEVLKAWSDPGRRIQRHPPSRTWPFAVDGEMIKLRSSSPDGSYWQRASVDAVIVVTAVLGAGRLPRH